MAWSYNSVDGNAPKVETVYCDGCGSWRYDVEDRGKEYHYKMLCEKCADEMDEEVSNCCAALPRGNGDNDSKDYGLCSDCGDHCDYVRRGDL